MMVSTALLAFNRGIVSRLGLARIDVKRLALSAETMTNWMPRVLGSMSIRPGLGYLGATKSNLTAKFLPFVFSITDTAKIELTNTVMRVWVSDALVTRESVSSAVANGDFDTDVASWTDNDESGATSSWATGGYLQLVGTGTNAAIRDQTVTVAAGDQGVEHALRIVVQRGPVLLRVGTSAGDDSYISETTLNTGIHSLSFTPTGNFVIRFFSRLERIVLVDSCNVEAAGVVEITAPWEESDLRNIRFDQSGDILFVACNGFQQRMIERRSTTSWSLVLYQSDDGPFRTENTGPITMTPSALSGNITLTASNALFKSTNVGSLYYITSEGQLVTDSLNAEDTWTDPIRITGVDSSRVFTIVLSGTWTATVTLQRSLESETGPWEDITTPTWTANTTETFDDGLDNQIAWYRIGIKTGDYGANTVVASLDYALGSITGVVRVTAFSSTTSVSAEVLTTLGGLVASDIWAEGEWSDRRGWPSAVGIHEGRLWWAGKSGIWGSVSDAFDSFDADVIGDSGTIARTLASGPVDTINWLLSSQRLLVGAQGNEYAARSSSLDEPLTPTAFMVKITSTQGSANVQAQRLDSRAVFVNRTGMKVFETSMNPQTYDYGITDLAQLVPEIGDPGIVSMAIQRQPDTRIHCVRSDGTVAIAVIDRNEEVLGWCEVETDGQVEDVVILPASSGDIDDYVYYVVKRTINGSVVRYLEKWAQSNTCYGDAVCNLADSYVTYTGAAAVNIPVAHLEGQEVVVWADGEDVGTDTDYTQTYTVSGGQITLSSAATNVTVGLPYTAQFKSTKLGPETKDLGTPLGKHKRITDISLIMADTHAHGIRFGPDFTHLDERPGRDEWKNVPADQVDANYDQDSIQFPTTWTTDLRICLQAQAPRPCTILAVAFDMEMQ